MQAAVDDASKICTSALRWILNRLEEYLSRAPVQGALTNKTDFD